MAYQSSGFSNTFDGASHHSNGVDGIQESYNASVTSRKSSIGSGTHKSSLQIGSVPSDGITLPYSSPPSMYTVTSSSTGRLRALSRSQLSQTSTLLSVQDSKIQPGSELVNIYDKKHHQIADAPYPLCYDSLATDLYVVSFNFDIISSSEGIDGIMSTSEI
jgi:hypothetical protein